MRKNVGVQNVMFFQHLHRKWPFLYPYFRFLKLNNFRPLKNFILFSSSWWCPLHVSINFFFHRKSLLLCLAKKRAFLINEPLYWCTYNLLLILLFFLPPERTYLLSIAGTHFFKKWLYSSLLYSTCSTLLTRRVVFKQKVCKEYIVPLQARKFFSVYFYSKRCTEVWRTDPSTHFHLHV